MGKCKNQLVVTGRTLDQGVLIIIGNTCNFRNLKTVTEWVVLAKRSSQKGEAFEVKSICGKDLKWGNNEKGISDGLCTNANWIANRINWIWSRSRVHLSAYVSTEAANIPFFPAERLTGLKLTKSFRKSLFKLGNQLANSDLDSTTLERRQADCLHLSCVCVWICWGMPVSQCSIAR